MKNLKNKNGITLVALVITIVVLLILSMITICALNDGGIIGKAKEAREEYNVKEAKEKIKIVMNEWLIIDETENVKDFGEFLKDKFGQDKVSGSEEIYTVTYGDYKFSVKDNGEYYRIETLIVGSGRTETNAIKTEDGLIYVISNDEDKTAYVMGEREVASYTGFNIFPDAITEGDVEILDKVNINNIEYSVTSIREQAFNNCTNLSSIKIPNSITTIGSSAFGSCTSLNSIEIPNSVTSIGDEAFSGCSSLSSVTYKGTTYTDNSELTIALTDNGVELGEIPFRNTALLNSACIAKGTLITLADGSKIPVEDLKLTDKVLAYNMEKGCFETTSISFINNHGGEEKERDILHLYFEEEKDLKIINDHGLFDIDKGEYIVINEENYNEYIGDNFVIYSENSNKKWDVVKLESVNIEKEITVPYSVATVGNINCITNDVLSIGPKLTLFTNMFKVDTSKLKYDEVSMEEDINKYGIFSYSDCEDLITEKVYNIFNIKYLKVAIGKGNTDWDSVIKLMNYYLKDMK